MATKINWIQAKTDYVGSETTSLADIAAKYGVSETAVAERASGESWTTLRRQALEKVERKLMEKLPEHIARFKEKQAKIGRLMQAKGVEGMQSRHARTLEEAARVADLGLKTEKEAIGITDEPSLKRRIVAEEFFES